MINILLFVHIIISLLLIAVILLQRTSSDGLSGIGGSSNMGIVAGRTAANFLTKTTILLAAFFIINSIVLANLSSKKNVGNKIETSVQKEEKSIPIK